ncbi:unnamed protein product [Meganyctiphanes norvegica]|uniref:Platelet-derived growth factor (PDGF) family profile domain-containing protein n=1 Tax=Meganyctiphanes norvegica TaxID=48144 RepID=A0AAV2Q159_MEGNR
MVGTIPMLILFLGVINLGNSKPHEHKQELDKDGDYEDSITEQQKALDNMGCKPVLQKKYVSRYVDTKDDLLDHFHWPTVVGILRCDNSCSYCGNEFGQEEKECQPVQDKIRKKHFVIAYFSKEGPKKYRRLKTKEHTECHCVLKK